MLEYLCEWRRTRAEVYVPLVHRPGESAQADFFEVSVELAGERRLDGGSPARAGIDRAVARRRHRGSRELASQGVTGGRRSARQQQLHPYKTVHLKKGR